MSLGWSWGGVKFQKSTPTKDSIQAVLKGEGWRGWSISNSLENKKVVSNVVIEEEKKKKYK